MLVNEHFASDFAAAAAAPLLIFALGSSSVIGGDGWVQCC